MKVRVPLKMLFTAVATAVATAAVFAGGLYGFSEASHKTLYECRTDDGRLGAEVVQWRLLHEGYGLSILDDRGWVAYDEDSHDFQYLKDKADRFCTTRQTILGPGLPPP